MKSLGIRQTKSHLSELVRSAARGECSLITDNGKMVAMIAPPPKEDTEAEHPPEHANENAGETEPLSDAVGFRRALFSAPYPLDLDF